MDQFEKKEVIQAILIADNNLEHFRPFSDTNSIALLPLVNVAILDYALEALNRSGIEEVFIYASLFIQNVRDHVKSGIASIRSWSVNMKVHVIGGEGCRCFGDAMRDLDAKSLIRGNFILLGANTVMNVSLKPIFEEHKKFVKYDKGAVATLIFKESSSNVRTGNEIMIAMDKQNNRLHHHQRLRTGNNKESHFEIPLEVFMLSSQIMLLHDLLDPQIAIGSPAMLSLFSDNFDFATRDDFVRGILINEEILDSRIYVSLLPKKQYARKVSNWLTYQIVSQDIISRWVYPLVPDMGICCMSQQYIFLKNNIYKNPHSSLTKVTLGENVVIQTGSSIEQGSAVTSSVIGRNCKIGQNCNLTHAYLMDNVSISDNCTLSFCMIGASATIGPNSSLTHGAVVGANCMIPANTKIHQSLVISHETEEDDVVKKLSDKAFVIADEVELPEKGSDVDWEHEDEDEVLLHTTGDILRMCKLPVRYEESDYTSSEDEDESQLDVSPQPDDANIFLSEVMDSLARGYQEKSNPDFLILEINSSRYAYNMSLKEVNFNVVKALFSLKEIRRPANNNVLQAINSVLKQLGPVMTNYIKSEDAMIDCLKALEDIYDENEHVREKISQIVHYLYDKDFISEDAILAWYAQLDEEEHQSLQQSLKKLIDWLEQSSDEDDDDDDADNDDDDNDDDSDE